VTAYLELNNNLSSKFKRLLIESPSIENVNFPEIKSKNRNADISLLGVDFKTGSLIYNVGIVYFENQDNFQDAVDKFKNTGWKEV
jgi:hypothetical protein